jgi:cytochrome c-type biogenesis protein CcmH
MKLRHLLFSCLLLTSLWQMPLAQANEAAPLAADPVVEKRLVSISEELRCLVCQNESIAGSRAELAQDLRREIRSQIKDGKTDDEIMKFMVDRYGDFVRYRPPMNATTLLLWFGPFLLLLAGLIGLILHLRGRAASKILLDETALSDDQRRAAEALLNSSIDENRSQTR